MGEPDIRRCETHSCHYDTRWGCPMCPRGEAKWKLEREALQASVAAWKDAWFKQREATGKVAWEVPIHSYLSVEVDPRNYAWHLLVMQLLVGLFRLLHMAMDHAAEEERRRLDAHGVHGWRRTCGECVKELRTRLKNAGDEASLEEAQHCPLCLQRVYERVSASS